MAGGDDKQFDPTQRRLDQAREQGQGAVSTDLFTGVVLIAGLIGLSLASQGILEGFTHELRDLTLSGLPKDLGSQGVVDLLSRLLHRGLNMIATMLVVVAACVLLTGLLQSGFRFSPAVLGLRWTRLTQGWDRLASLGNLSKIGMNLLKLGLLLSVAWWFLGGNLALHREVGDADVRSWAAHAWSQAIALAWRMAGLLFCWGFADFAWQRRQFFQQMRMSFEELKQEHRASDGDPQVKAKIKQRRQEVAKLRMVKEIPTSTVMVTNPTHLAVALRYDRVKGSAPRVVAKGEGLLAKYLVRLAKKHGVPVVERKSLARALFKTVRLNQEIPLGMYIVVAELIRYVDQLKGIAPPPGMQAPPEPTPGDRPTSEAA